MRGTHVLPLHDLDSAGKPYDAELTEGFLRGQLEDTDITVKGPGRVTIRYSRAADDVIVHGRVKGAFAVACARCLAPADFPVDADLALLLVPSASERAAHARGRTGRRRDPHGGGEGGFTAGLMARQRDGGGVPGAHGKKPEKPKAAADAAAATAPAKGKADKAKKGKAAEDDENDPADADLDTYEGEELNLDPFVREAILLEVPPFPLCSTNCPGIAPPPTEAEPPGEEVDPRLAPLLRFKKQPSLRKRREKDNTVAVPKRRTTRSKSKMRRAQHDKVTAPNLSPCSQCGEPSLPHRVCGSCGYFKGKQIVTKSGSLARPCWRPGGTLRG